MQCSARVVAIGETCNSAASLLAKANRRDSLPSVCVEREKESGETIAGIMQASCGRCGMRLAVQLALCVAAVLQLHPAAGKGLVDSQWSLKNIRISPHYHSSVQQLSREQQVLLKDVLIKATLSWFSAVLKVHPKQTPLTLERSCNVTHKTVGDTRYCMGTCSPVTKCGPVPIPDHHLQPCRSCIDVTCTVSRGSVEGVPETDLVVYVSALHDSYNCQSELELVYGDHCQRDSASDRPTAAYLNICPSFLFTSTNHYHLQIAYLVHHLVRILAFSRSLFPFFRDEWGNPLNDRDHEGLPHRRYGQYISDGTVRYYSHVTWQVAENVTDTVDGLKGPIVHDVKMIVTPNVVREVQDHFGCSDVIGGELESQYQSRGTVDSLWEKRVFGEEVMTASTSYHPILSRLTLALLHDSGWYLPDYSYGGNLHWGRGQGCGFIEGSCYKWVGPKNMESGSEGDMGPGASIVPFCRRYQSGTESCVEQRRAIGVCTIKNYPARLPKQYQYFSTGRRGGASPAVDYCPIYQYDIEQTGRTCMTAPNTASTFVPEEYGPDSRCFDHKWAETVGGGGAGCYLYTCTREHVVVNVTGQEVLCRERGQKTEVQFKQNGTTYTGYIVCPAYDELCENYDCPRMCSGHGNCDRGHCRCQPGFHGDDCSRSYLDQVLRCDDVSCQNGGSCVTNGNHYGFTCECPVGFTGMLCETELVPDPCHNISCHGNGFCTRSGLGMEGQCECVPGYGGEGCDQLLLCEQWGRPCHHGYCHRRKSGEPFCVCDEGYRGPLCNHRDDPCLSSPCHNGANCTSTTHTNGKPTYKCSCTPGYKGRRCGKRKNPCLRPNPCTNGEQCIRNTTSAEWGQFYCRCPEDQLCIPPPPPPL